MADSFDCSLVTPEEAVFDEPVTYANVPAHDGLIGFLPNRAPLLAQLGEGVLEVRVRGGGTRRFELAGGFAQMNRNRLTLLSEKATELSNT